MWRNDQLDATQVELLGQHIIDLGGEVDEPMIRYTREAITRLVAKGSPDITVRLTSAGGNAGMGVDIYDLLRTYSGQVTGEVYGYAFSMACVILQACDKRRAAPHAMLLIHSVMANGVSYDDLLNPPRRGQDMANTTRLQNWCVGILTKRSGKSEHQVRAQLRRDKKMTAVEAKAFGLIDEII